MKHQDRRKALKTRILLKVLLQTNYRRSSVMTSFYKIIELQDMLCLALFGIFSMAKT